MDLLNPSLHLNGGEYANVVGFANYKITVKIAVNNTYNILSIFDTIHNEKIEMCFRGIKIDNEDIRNGTILFYIKIREYAFMYPFREEFVKKNVEI